MQKRGRPFPLSLLFPLFLALEIAGASTFSYEMKPRYAKQSSNLDRPVIPNTIEYVQNRTECGPSLLGSRTAAIASANNILPPGATNTLKFKTKLAFRFSQSSMSNPSPVISRLRYKFSVEKGGNVVFSQRNLPGGAAEYWHCLEQGSYTVKVSAYKPGNAPSVPTALGGNRLVEVRGSTDTVVSNQQFDMSIKDILIVGLGDSYSSGEGAPEYRDTKTYSVCGTPHPTNIPVQYGPFWANDGSAVYSEKETCGCSGQSTGCARGFVLSNPGGVSAEYSKHKQHHRSSNNPSSLFALKMEDESAKTSVTYVNLAESGARIGDLTQQNTQLDKLKALILDREIDYLVMTIGGNDAGFGNVIQALIARDDYSNWFRGGQLIQGVIGNSCIDVPDIKFNDLTKHELDGDWANYENEVGCTVAQNPTVKWETLLGIDSLISGKGNMPGYLDLKNAIAQRGIVAKKTFLLEYPNLAENCGTASIMTGVTVGQMVGPIDYTKGLEIGSRDNPGEFDHIKAYADNLNTKVRQGAAGNGWTFVPIRQAMAGHEMCRPSRWFVELKESKSLCLEDQCAAHPNANGYKTMADRIFAHR